MSLKLKDYQKKALAALEAFLTNARGLADEVGLSGAFQAARAEALGESAPRVAYRASTELPGTPQCCIRIPTGGGKTLLAAHAVERAARLYVGTRAPVVLWLVPSNVIRAQTVDALKAPDHSYRDALLEHFPPDRLSVLDIEECEQLRAQDFGARAIVIVATMQTLRVENTTGRQVYAYKEAFEPHFATLPDADFFERVGERDIEAHPYLARSDLGKVKRSFANLLAWHRPIVIVDEAHNSRSDLSFEVLKRVRPACVIEWTATPARDQNVLYHVSAQELKAEHMIKLPIVLAAHPNWREAVRDALLTRDVLAKAALGETDYIRPIVLFQAEPKGGEATVEVLKTHLVDELKIAEQRVVVATGSQRGLDGVDLFDRACPVDFVITVEALKEGWDCSFAYVFCTAQNVRSAKDMEQLLGRVLRLPYARERTAEALNRAYAHVCAAATAQAATKLGDRLVALGFEQMEAAQFLHPKPEGDLFAPATTQSGIAESVFELPTDAALAVSAVLADESTLKPFAEDASTAEVILRGPLEPEAIERAISASPKRDRGEVSAMLERHQMRALTTLAPSQRGIAFAPVPRLALSIQGTLQLFEPDLIRELVDYSLAGLSADVPGFMREDAPHPYLIDIERGRLSIKADDSQYGLDLDGATEGVSRNHVIRELDRRLRHESILQPDMIDWLGRVLDGMERRNLELAYLARHINQLADACARRLTQLLDGAQRTAFQQSLLGDRRPRLDDRFAMHFDPNTYPARWLFAGRWRFRKHYYALPGELNPDTRAEETACAIELDQLDEVQWWVRNLERQPSFSFWLPTSTDRFYPDFVAQLNDGRLLVVEYKGAHLWAGAAEKRDIGAVWADVSGGRCVFVMVTDQATAGKPVRVQLRDAIA